VSTALTKAIAARLVELREQRGMSQDEVAHKAKLQRVSVSRIERGVHEPSLTTLGRIAKALGVSLVVEFR
jgi:transcriptional regulator with XRE-family HTH domain